MKKNKNINERINFTKKAQKGISLIVLVITIILIVILASAIILSISNNNPVKEANLARYESDTANMQAIFTNSVAKVMASNKSTISIKAGQVNVDTSGVSEAIGEIEYTLEYAMNKDNTYGKIIFDTGTSTEKVYYTGRKLPIYAAGETKWYVDSEGLLSLEVEDMVYGNGKTPLVPGLYDENNEMIASWDELVNDYGIDVERDYISEEDMYNYMENAVMPESIQNGEHPGGILLINEKLSKGTKLIVGNEVTKIGSGIFIGNATVKEIELPDSINLIGMVAFALCENLKNIDLPKNITEIPLGCFANCTSLEYVDIPDSVVSIGNMAFYSCFRLERVTLDERVTSIGEDAFLRM